MKRAWTLLLACSVGLAASDRVPMTAKFEDSASYRWLNKKVLESRVLDDCESLARWAPFTTGGIPLVDARVDIKASDADRPVAEMALTGEGSRDEGRFLRMRVPARLDVPGPKSGRALDFEISGNMTDTGEAIIKLTARGSGTHRFAVRVDNLTLSDPVKELTLEPDRPGVLEWRGRIGSKDTPWVVVVYPDDDLARRKEARGAAWER